MKIVRCSLPNASTFISGVPFTQHEDKTHVFSGPLSPEVAEQFSGIKGYHIEDVEPVRVEPEVLSENPFLDAWVEAGGDSARAANDTDRLPPDAKFTPTRRVGRPPKVA